MVPVVRGGGHSTAQLLGGASGTSSLHSPKSRLLVVMAGRRVGTALPDPSQDRAMPGILLP